jgi:hypothetical protein
MNEEHGTTTIVEKDSHRGSWDALWAAGGFAAGWFAGRNGNGNCNNNGCGCGPVPYGPASAAAATAYYNEGIMAGENRAGLNYATQAITNGNQEMRAGFAQMNAQFTNILDREYQRVLAENTSLKNNSALCATVGPINTALVGLSGQVGCIQRALGNTFVYSKDICGNCGD